MLRELMIVEDEEEIAVQLAEFLGKHEYQCRIVTDFSNVAEQILEEEPDVVLLDLSLPGTDGESILKSVRKASDVPILVVTSKNTELDEVLCMSCGADDFIAKPYNPSILLLHIDAVCKRAGRGNGETPEIISCGPLSLNVSRGGLEVRGSSLELTKNEMRILAYLMRHAGQVVSREELIGYLWDAAEFVDDNTLTVNVNRVRGKLKEFGLDSMIQTRRGIGYILE